MKNINTFTVNEIKMWYSHKYLKHTSRYVLARPTGSTSLLNRIKLAYAVFTGKADVLYWEKQ